MVSDLELVLVAVGIIVLGLAIGYAVGKYQDIVWRGKTMRKYMKRNYMLIKLISTDNKTIGAKLMNVKKDSIMLGDSLWIAREDRIFRESKQESGFFVNKDIVKYEEGLPTIYISEKTMQPIPFDEDAGQVRPAHIGNVLKELYMNQIARERAKSKNQNIFLYIIIVGIVILLGGTYMTYSAIDKVDKKVSAILVLDENQTATMNGGVVQKVNNPNMVGGK